eukprot:c15342_g1_i2.p1 GENE.c15342_g1_i2~~c15342_g1_i2.p1  ORF type:complete len:509 (+),score=114.13 c15342_g1_i2:51-1577(+)
MGRKRSAPNTNKPAAKPRNTESKRERATKSRSMSSNTNQYEGHCLNPGDAIERVNVADLNPETMFERYVAKRKPVVLVGHLPEDELQAFKWSRSYLRKHAGDAQLKVEHRDSSDGMFGQGKEVPMTYSEFLDHIEAGEDKWYLTTQDLPQDDRGQPSIMAAPLTHVADDLVVRPSLLSSLVPYSINVWHGVSASHASSGLHHDFHDNLYVLLKGNKQFTLFSPDVALTMHTRGQIIQVHPNGRINYAGLATHADGSDADAEQAQVVYQQQLSAESRLAAAEAALERGEQEAVEALQEAEDELDDALEALLNSNDAADETLFDDNSFGNGSDDQSDEEDPATAKAWKDLIEGNKKEKKPKGDHTSTEPLNFCLIPREVRQGVNHKRAKKSGKGNENRTRDEGDYADFEAIRARGVKLTIKAGEMLFLPAGWFHEVESFGATKEQIEKDEPSGGEAAFEGELEVVGEHMALNFWFHPPDGKEFSKPYTRPFWETDWALRRTNLKPKDTKT